ncbi:hypothetical protein [Pelagibacterium limicola]|uniref:hypothetical protein n=1 Tax=Pelagibacterium limicola TaxID=2791022 RepID=UPI0018AF99E8|nr:hypothetical protein [Pelagibacterium limicola]
MALPSLNFEHTDVSLWGIAALVCGTLAVISANLAPLVPENIIAGLHTTRMDGGNINQMRAQMLDVRAENQRLMREARTLLARLNLLDDDSGEMIRRLAAVERSLPILIESLPLHSDIDRSILTASIAGASPEVYEADGGIVIVRHSALFDEIGDPFDQPLPPRLGGLEYGIAIGHEVALDAAPGQRGYILSQTGPLLTGMSFVLGEVESVDSARIIAGPLSSAEDAGILCEPLIVMGMACEPVPFEGAPWPD